MNLMPIKVLIKIHLLQINLQVHHLSIVEISVQILKNKNFLNKFINDLNIPIHISILLLFIIYIIYLQSFIN